MSAVPSVPPAVREIIWVLTVEIGPVFPCVQCSKKPRTQNGFKDATRNLDTIDQQWSLWPDSLVGVPTGSASGLLVIDYDSYKHDAASDAWVAQHRALLNQTRRNVTARGGEQFVFRLPEGVQLRSHQRAVLGGQKRNAIDIRGNGGYVIWWPAHGLESSGEIKVLPRELLEQFPNTKHTNVVPDPPPTGQQSQWVWNAQRPDVLRALAYLDPADRDEWVQVGMAIHYASNGSSDGFTLWHVWSVGELTGTRPQNYCNEDDCRRTWNSFHRNTDRPLTLGTLFARAQARGFVLRPPVHPELKAAPIGASIELHEHLLALPPDVASEIQQASADTLFLPNDYFPAPVAAARIFDHLGGTRELFLRGSAVVELDHSGHISVVTSTALRSRLNNRGRKVRAFKVDARGKLIHAAKQCSEDTAKLLLSTVEVHRLPEIRLVTRMPILVERDGQLCTTEPGYNADCGVLVTSTARIPTLAVNDSAAALRGLLRDFLFADEGDRARALASLIAPTLRMSGLVRGDALVTSAEADQSQTGKGYLLQAIRVVYGEKAYTITQKKGGVGSFDESVGQGLMSGVPFVFFDNLRGMLNSQYLESIITAGSDPISARVPHRGEVQVDISRTSFQLTSNGVSGTTDLSNRLLLIRLRKQSAGYAFAQFPEGNLLQHIKANDAYYLGCVHAIVRHWYAAGKPELPSAHSFRHWVGVLDWIACNVWGTVPILEGHAAAIIRIASPGMTWLRQLAFLVIQDNLTGQELPTSKLRDLCRDHDLIPDGAHADRNDAELDRALGRVIGRCFDGRDLVELDGVRVLRTVREEIDIHRNKRERKFYIFSRAVLVPPPPPA